MADIDTPHATLACVNEVMPALEPRVVPDANISNRSEYSNVPPKRSPACVAARRRCNASPILSTAHPHHTGLNTMGYSLPIGTVVAMSSEQLDSSKTTAQNLDLKHLSLLLPLPIAQPVAQSCIICQPSHGTEPVFVSLTSSVLEEKQGKCRKVIVARR
ncbi:uncharacterized protein PHACADRAFT_201874 [Phanerochaete carnosa HHB-10118-sp]|uniref:Uncharacterized protein n=1 Tax=Phanerochaete carnosa (strain HHB-10118-sp) TaxID=650164 RepID=K5VDM7_PHACS|nr:uncharacterized protein PHACADRAFT_201874 [Phanerochaete carnosa HHB-10118-sp]EKM49233.1 hypothetical protein PHACADRAFT_201874 [Phanerochaete carnosa HHB-10118-sp]